MKKLFQNKTLVVGLASIAVIISLVVTVGFISRQNLEPDSTVPTDPSRLVVQITIDQLRNDLFQVQAAQKIHNSGFNFLIDNGIYYQNAQYQHANTFTAVGHSTLATGVSPSIHGIIDNQWFDIEQNRSVYCTEDSESFLVTDLNKNAGSPKRLKHSTLAEKVIEQGGKAYAISVKDRGAIYIAGKKGKALWFDKKTGKFTSSTYYYEHQPDWLVAYNNKNRVNSFVNRVWDLSRPANKYNQKVDERAYENTPVNYDNSFPHPLPKEINSDFYKALSISPFGDELTLDFAKHLVETHSLGNNGNVDFLSISLSANDYVGHNFGAFSLEAEDHKHKLDIMLGEFFQYLDKSVGLDKVTFALSSDHGVAPSAEHHNEQNKGAHRIKESALLKELNTLLLQKYHWKVEPLAHATLPFLSVNPELYATTNESKRLIQAKLVEVIKNHPNIADAHAIDEMEKSDRLLEAEEDLYYRMANSFYHGRSGEIMISAHPYINYAWDNGTYISIHGTPYKYDTHVPLIIARKGTDAKKVMKLAAPKQLSPSLAKLMNIEWEEHKNTVLLPQIDQFKD